ncbi:hypothetical protein [Streptomyces sp. NPDC048002]|uniref:hypothetical protein n=1 Tax=Streptomyces sp. NPDC048002 TaxID=3154344 RepID=UPI0033E3B002
MARSDSGGRTPPGVETCLRALRHRNIQGPNAVVRALKEDLGELPWAEASIRSWLNGTRKPGPEFMGALARLAGVSVADVFVELGWLRAEEVSGPDVASLMGQLRDGITALGRLPRAWEAPWFDRAPVAAATAVLSSDHGARRFTAELTAVRSGEAYPTVVLDVAEFRLRPGEKPLPLTDAVELLRRERVWDAAPGPEAPEPGPAHDYWSTRLELTALAHPALQERGEYSWQGRPGARLWLDPRDGHRPRHLLVQDRLAAVERSARAVDAAAPGPAVPPLVVIGRRPLAGGAAALLAEGLGMQYVLPRSGAEVTPDGFVVPVRRERLAGRVEGWLKTSEHLSVRHRTSSPWRAVVLARPYVFAGPGCGSGDSDDRALRALLDLPAHVVFVRPATAMLHWWAARQADNGVDSEGGPEGWVERELRLYARIEETLRDRPADRTLLLRVPEPDTPLPVSGWGWPAAVSDLQPRLARAVLDWLDRTVNRRGPRLAECLGPGQLKEWAPTLDRDGQVSALKAY